MRRSPLILALGGLVAIVALALLVVGILGETERYGGGAGEGEGITRAAPQREVTSGNVRLSVTLTPEEGKVGEIVTIQGRVTDTAGAPVRNVRFEVVSHHLEDDVPVFRSTFVSPDGTFTWGNQFWDGTEHEIRITASPGPDASQSFSPLQLRRVVEVEAVPPTLAVQLRAMFWLLLPVAVGLAIGIPLGLRIPMRGARPLRESAAAA